MRFAPAAIRRVKQMFLPEWENENDEKCWHQDRLLKMWERGF